MRYDKSLIAPIVKVLHNCVKYLPLRVKTCTIHLQSQEQKQEQREKQSQERQCWLTPYIYSFFVVRESKCKVKNKVKNVSVGSYLMSILLFVVRGGLRTKRKTKSRTKRRERGVDLLYTDVIVQIILYTYPICTLSIDNWTESWYNVYYQGLE